MDRRFEVRTRNGPKPERSPTEGVSLHLFRGGDTVRGDLERSVHRADGGQGLGLVKAKGCTDNVVNAAFKLILTATHLGLQSGQVDSVLVEAVGKYHN